jgi:hypothetical protein
MSGRPGPSTQKVLNDRIGQVKGKNGKIWPATAELRKLFSLRVSRDSVKLSLTCVSWTSGGDCWVGWPRRVTIWRATGSNLATAWAIGGRGGSNLATAW